MKASDFAGWAGPRAAHIENTVTVVTAVTCGQELSVPAAFDPGAAVTAATKAVVTVVAETEALPSSVALSTLRPAGRSAGGQIDDQRFNHSNHDDPENGSSSAALDEERSAIIEIDTVAPRAWAEGFARLDPGRPPGDVPLRRWQRFVDDVGMFLDSPFCAVAASLGWGSIDLLGCDFDRPFARIDQAGLLWSLNGDRPLAISEDTAVIETGTGARQVFRRKPNGAGRVLAWELRP